MISRDEKPKVFKKELEFIKDSGLRQFATDLLKEVPSYFFEVPASSTGKYHPRYAQGNGGLVRHVKACMMVAKSLFNISAFNEREQDLILIALLFHDSIKKGASNNTYTSFTHPIQASDFVRRNYYQNLEKYKHVLSGEEILFICKGIESHMGKFNWDRDKTPILPTPRSKSEYFIHMCDYLGSRKFLEVNFAMEVV